MPIPSPVPIRSFLPMIMCATALLGRAQDSAPRTTSGSSLSAADYPSIQAAVDANPGRVLHVPAGDHIITEKIRLTTSGSGLSGPGRIIQTNADAPILEISGGRDIRISDLTLTRSAGKEDTRAEGIVAINCRDLWMDRIKVIDNRTRSAAIAVRESEGVRISDCLVRNYMKVSVDDRTGSEGYGYAFKCIDGTGIAVSYSTSVLIEGNRVIEEQLLPIARSKSSMTWAVS